MIKSEIPEADLSYSPTLGNLQNKVFKLDDFKRPKIQEFPEFKDIPKKKFKNTAFGRTLRGKNKTGKIVYSALGLAGGVAYGVDLQPVLNLISNNPTNTMNLEFWDLLIYVVIAALTVLTSRSMIKGLLNDIALEITDALEALRKARRSDSPEGKDLSPEEVKMLLKEVDDVLTIVWRRLLRSKIASFLGLDKSIFINSKSKEN